MQIIPVLDLAGGIAVHARAGDRARYAPVESVLAPGRPGDAMALVQAYREERGRRGMLRGRSRRDPGGPVQRTFLRELADFETGFAGALLVDAGTSSAGGALEVLACGASQIVVGLETLRAFADLARMVEVVDPARTVFSLDLRLDVPVLHPAMQDAYGAVASPRRSPRRRSSMAFKHCWRSTWVASGPAAASISVCSRCCAAAFPASASWPAAGWSRVAISTACATSGATAPWWRAPCTPAASPAEIPPQAAARQSAARASR